MEFEMWLAKYLAGRLSAAAPLRGEEAILQTARTLPGGSTHVLYPYLGTDEVAEVC